MNYIQSKHGYIITCPVQNRMELLIHSQNLTVVPLKFGNGLVIYSTLHNGCNGCPDDRCLLLWNTTPCFCMGYLNLHRDKPSSPKLNVWFRCKMKIFQYNFQQIIWMSHLQDIFVANNVVMFRMLWKLVCSLYWIIFKYSRPQVRTHLSRCELSLKKHEFEYFIRW